MSSAYVFLATDQYASRQTLDKLLAKIFPKSYELEASSSNLYKLTLLDGQKALVLFQTSFRAASLDLYGGLKALVVPTLNDCFVQYLKYVQPQKIEYLFQLGQDHPEIYQECQSLIEDIDGDTLFTISTYIENENSPSLSALRLYVHRNTVTYRITRFIQQTGISLDSFGNVMFVYYLIQNRKLELEGGYI
jgi:sugar diacid utilization regulator